MTNGGQVADECGQNTVSPAPVRGRVGQQTRLDRPAATHNLPDEPGTVFILQGGPRAGLEISVPDDILSVNIPDPRDVPLTGSPEDWEPFTCSVWVRTAEGFVYASTSMSRRVS